MRGGNIHVYVDSATWIPWATTGPATLQHVCELQDSAIADSRNESERGTRCDDETGVNPGTHATTEITFDYMPNQGPTANDTVYAVLSTAYKSATTLSVAYADGDILVAGTEVAWWGEMHVLDLSRTDGLNAESTISVVMKQAAVRVTGSPERNEVTALA